MCGCKLKETVSLIHQPLFIEPLSSSTSPVGQIRCSKGTLADVIYLKNDDVELTGEVGLRAVNIKSKSGTTFWKNFLLSRFRSEVNKDDCMCEGFGL